MNTPQISAGLRTMSLTVYTMNAPHMSILCCIQDYMYLWMHIECSPRYTMNAPHICTYFLCCIQDYVPLDTQLQFGNSKEHVRVLTESTKKIRDVAERVALRYTSYASDMLQLSMELGCVEGVWGERVCCGLVSPSASYLSQIMGLFLFLGQIKADLFIIIDSFSFRSVVIAACCPALICPPIC